MKMKKPLFSIVISLISILSAYAQISVADKGRLTSLIIATDSYCCVIKNESNYELRVSSQNSLDAGTITIVLGPDEQSAIGSLSQIEEWMDNAVVSEYMIIEQNGTLMTIYKSHSNRLMISTGDQYYCKQIMTSIATGWDTKASLPYGYFTNVIIKRALKKLRSTN